MERYYINMKYGEILCNNMKEFYNNVINTNFMENKMKLFDIFYVFWNHFLIYSNF